MNREEFAWVQEAIGVKDIPDTLLQFQVFRGENHPHELLLLEANPVFTRQRTAGIDTGTQNGTASGKHSLDFILVTLIKEHNRVQVAIARVKNIRNPKIVFCSDLFNLLEDLREFCAGNHAILRCMARRKPTESADCFFTRRP